MKFLEEWTPLIREMLYHQVEKDAIVGITAMMDTPARANALLAWLQENEDAGTEEVLHHALHVRKTLK